MLPAALQEELHMIVMSYDGLGWRLWYGTA